MKRLGIFAAIVAAVMLLTVNTANADHRHFGVFPRGGVNVWVGSPGYYGGYGYRSYYRPYYYGSYYRPWYGYGYYSNPYYGYYSYPSYGYYSYPYYGGYYYMY